MPELPEVETIARQLKNEKLVGQTIEAIDISWPKTLTASKEDILGKSFTDVSRRGKFLILHLSEGDLYIHLRMTGRLILGSSRYEYERVRFLLSNGQALIFSDPRKFGRIYYNPAHIQLGPDAVLDPLIPELFLKSSRGIKAVLLDQSIIAGLGNIYVDEVLFATKIHPEKPANSLSLQEREALIDVIPIILQTAIDNGGTSIGKGKGNYFNLEGKRGGMQEHLQVYKKRGQPCPCCKTLIERIVVAGRGTHLCQQCQTQ